jgi:hypothetical protein
MESRTKKYGMATYNYGEGIYLEIDIGWLQDLADKREKELGGAASMDYSIQWIRQSLIDQIPDIEEEENRNAFTILHSFSHALIRRACEESGYSLNSIRERLYFSAEGGEVDYAGILLYTSGPTSDGTLGGLAGQAGIMRMGRVIELALQDLKSCSNDPVCFDHLPRKQEPNGAACHACLILPETSCECFNHMLDRNWG